MKWQIFFYNEKIEKTGQTFKFLERNKKNESQLNVHISKTKESITKFISCQLISDQTLDQFLLP